MTKYSPFRYFKTSPEIIRLAVMLYVRFSRSLRNLEDLLHERGIEISHETVRFWWNRFGPMFAAEIRRNRASRMRSYSNWQWHLDEVFVKINGEMHYLWRAVDHEGEVLDDHSTISVHPYWLSAAKSKNSSMNTAMKSVREAEFVFWISL